MAFETSDIGPLERRALLDLHASIFAGEGFCSREGLRCLQNYLGRWKRWADARQRRLDAVENTMFRLAIAKGDDDA